MQDLRTYMTMTLQVNAIQNLDIDTTTWNLILVHILTQKLDKESHRFFELSLTLEAIDNGKSITKQYRNNELTTSNKSQNVKTFITTTKAVYNKLILPSEATCFRK